MLEGKPAQDDAGLQSTLQSLPLIVRELIAGGVAGGLGKTSVAPLERTKILFQTGRLPSTSVFDTVVWLYKTEGIAGLYRGNGASVLRIVPYAAIHFSSYEYYRRWILAADSHLRGPRTSPKVHPVFDLLAGSIAGATAVAFTYPLDLVRTRLAWATESSLATTGKAKHHIYSVLRTTFRNEGLRGLYHGVAPTMLGILPYAGLKFYVYQSLKGHYRSLAESAAAAAAAATQDLPANAAVDLATAGAGRKQKEAAAAGVPERLPVPVMLLFGGVSGLAAQTATYPLDVVRRRMQVEGLQHVGGEGGGGVGLHPQQGVHRSGIWHTVKTIYGEGGAKALFRGLSINYMKVVPSTAIGFTVYDALKAYLGVKGNI